MEQRGEKRRTKETREEQNGEKKGEESREREQRGARGSKREQEAETWREKQHKSLMTTYIHEGRFVYLITDSGFERR